MLGKKRIALTAILTAGALYYTFRHVDAGVMWRSMIGANPVYIFLAVLAVLLTMVLRAYRWKYIIYSSKDVPVSRIYSPLFVGFTGNSLPLRIGDLIRAYLLSQRERLSFSQSLGTIFLERIMDVLSALILLASVFTFQTDFLDRAQSTAEGQMRMDELRAFGIGGFALCVVLLGLCWLLITRREWCMRWLKRLSAPLPERLAGRLLGTVDNFTLGIAALKDWRPLLVSFACSMAVWTIIMLTYVLLFRAFHLPHLSVAAATLVTLVVMGFIAAIPAPAFFGPIQAGVTFCLTTIFGVSSDVAAGVGNIFWAVSMIPIVLIGVFFIIRENLSLTELAELAGSGGKSPE